MYKYEKLAFKLLTSKFVLIVFEMLDKNCKHENSLFKIKTFNFFNDAKHLNRIFKKL